MEAIQMVMLLAVSLLVAGIAVGFVMMMAPSPEAQVRDMARAQWEGAKANLTLMNALRTSKIPTVNYGEITDPVTKIKVPFQGSARDYLSAITSQIGGKIPAGQSIEDYIPTIAKVFSVDTTVSFSYDVGRGYDRIVSFFTTKDKKIFVGVAVAMFESEGNVPTSWDGTAWLKTVTDIYKYFE